VVALSRVDKMSMNENDSVLVFEDVSKSYNGVRALNSVSFHIPRGSIFGYIGPNGAGKTTTIKIIVGLIQDFEGDVLIDGQRISELKTDVYRNLGYLPQEVGFQEWRTVGQMLTTFGRLSGLSKSQIETRIQDVLQLVSLHDVRNRKIVHLSGGMQQKLRLAQALLHEPDLLVLDEPMSGLDPTSRYHVKSIIKNLSERGVTIFFSSHILSDVQDIATLIGILNKGALMQVGTPQEIQNNFQVGNNIEVVVADSSPLCKNLDGIEGIEYVEHVSGKKQILHLKSGADVDLVIRSSIERMLSEGCQVRNLNLVRPSLEEVYIKYVEGDRE
jgi:ABC-2 type transport system ATP-binding protein